MFGPLERPLLRGFLPMKCSASRRRKGESFELWQGNRQIRAQQPQPRDSTASLIDLIEDHQRVVIDTEEVISQSCWTIARSRRLIETLNQVKSMGNQSHR